MIDTLSFTVRASLRPGILASLKGSLFWQVRESTTHCSGRTNSYTTLTCPPIALIIYVDGGAYVRSVSANLPKLLYGHNGRLIATEQQFTEAMNRLKTILEVNMQPDQFVAGIIPGWPNPVLGAHFTRVDLVWQFLAELGLLEALRHCRHDKIRKQASEYHGKSTSLGGSFLRIQVYDKNREMRIGNRKLPPAHRVEFQLKRHALADVYQWQHSGIGHAQLTWPWLQDTIRRIAHELHADLPCSNATDITGFLAYVRRRYPGFPIMEDYFRCRGLKEQRTRKLRRAVEACLAPLESASTFAELFPENGWPPVHELPLPDKEAEHADWMPRFMADLKQLKSSAIGSIDP